MRLPVLDHHSACHLNEDEFGELKTGLQRLVYLPPFLRAVSAAMEVAVRGTTSSPEDAMRPIVELRRFAASLTVDILLEISAAKPTSAGPPTTATTPTSQDASQLSESVD